MTHSQPILVVIDPTDTAGHLLQEAAAHARGTGSDLIVLSVMSTADYEARAEALNDLRQLNLYYTYDHAVDASYNVAERLALEALGDSDVEFTAIGYVGRPEDAVLAACDRYDCEHVFVAGHRRALRDVLRRIPDTAVSIERSFPGNVTVFYDHLFAESPESAGTDA